MWEDNTSTKTLILHILNIVACWQNWTLQLEEEKGDTKREGGEEEEAEEKVMESVYYSVQDRAEMLFIYRGADKYLARPGRKQATATEDFEFHISYL